MNEYKITFDFTNNVRSVKAHSVLIKDGCLVFVVDKQANLVVASGRWVGCEKIEYKA